MKKLVLEEIEHDKFLVNIEKFRLMLGNRNLEVSLLNNFLRLFRL